MINLMSMSPSNCDQYVSQTEFSMDEINDIDERTQTQQNLTTNNISTMMPPSTLTKNMEEKSTVSTSAIKENIEPLPPVAQHELGPIQRPTKLSCDAPTKQSSIFTDAIESPNTPDVLVQINHLLDRQNSISSTSKVPIVINSSTSINEISTPNVSWIPYSPIDWSSKYDSSWPESSNISLTRQQQQISSEESLIWPSNKDTQRSNQWNELMSPVAVPSRTEITKPTKNNSWLTFLPVSDSTSDDVITSDRQENETNNPLWNSNETQENSSASWWPKVSSSEKNDDDTDRSRWDFAR